MSVSNEIRLDILVELDQLLSWRHFKPTGMYKHLALDILQEAGIPRRTALAWLLEAYDRRIKITEANAA